MRLGILIKPLIQSRKKPDSAMHGTGILIAL